MAHSRAARRYAKALHGLAAAEGRTEAVRSGLQGLAGLLASSRELGAFVKNYTIPADKRKAVLESMFKEGIGRVDPLLLRFLLFLDSKHRLPLLGEVAHAYEVLSDVERKVLRVKITAPAHLDTEQLNRIGDRFRTRFGMQEVKADLRVDPRLLGGFTVQVGDQVFDFSVETQLQSIRQKLSFA